ncbi:MAG TPA: ATP-dependent DNA helicase RecG [Candidatus Paceibacterota bacterium]
MQLSDLLATQFRLKETQRKALKKLGLESVRDLLFYFPARYASQEDSIVAKVVSQETGKTFRSRVPMAKMKLEDLSGRKISATWFSQAYMAKKFSEGSLVRLSGKSNERSGVLSYANPRIELASDAESSGPLFSNLAPNTYDLVPVYPESRGVSTLWLTYAIQRVIKSGVIEKLEDPIPSEILKKYNLPSLASSLIFVHSPKKLGDAKAARKRFSFQEIFLIQLARQKARAGYSRAGAFVIARAKALPVPFIPTNAQDKALAKIFGDISKPHPMARLLEGDVGSGKTYVAASVANAVVQNHLQVAYMAPTEILTKQHFESFIEFFKDLPVQIGLLTGSECRKFPSKVEASGSTHVSRTQLLKWIADGSMSIVVGTHAHIAESVKWKNLALVIIDEQHRFGTHQRGLLAQKSGAHGKTPHLLSMTATPIPRTLALTIYGDLDLTLLDESPAGRKPIITRIIKPSERSEVYEHIRREIKSGRQAFVICPRINEPDPTKEMALETKDVKSETDKLGNEIFPEFVVAGLHGKMSSSEKDEIMSEFVAGEINILVATSVIEVGVNVPNATIIVIEGAERFGLAQLHQLRGRVLRSSHQAHCYLSTTKDSKDIPARLKAIEKAKNGFELAEQDLKLRGPGSLVGNQQWGISDVGMEALQNLKLVEAARNEAGALLSQDPELRSYPLLREVLATQPIAHFE